MKVYGVTVAHAREKRAVRLLCMVLPCPYVVVFLVGFLVRKSWFTSLSVGLKKFFSHTHISHILTSHTYLNAVNIALQGTQ